MPKLAEKPEIKLAIVTETWPPEVNGVANTLRNLVQGLLEQDHYQIELIRPRQNPEQSTLKHPRLQEVLVNGLTLPFYREVRLGLPKYSFLKKRWQQQRPDIVQIVTEGPLGYSAVKAAKALDIPVFSDFHTNFDQYSKYYRLSLLSRIAKRYLRRLHNQTAVTLVPTNSIRQELSQAGYENLGILPRGVDIGLFNPQRRNPALREQLGINPEQLVIVMVTRMAKEKNLDLAFNAFRDIQATLPDAKFLLVGDGPERKRLEAEHRDCIFVGMKRGAELAAYYASADLFIYPSTSETFGNVVTEAMASQLPVVTFDYAAAREHIRSGINGIAIPLDDNPAFIQAAARLSQDAEQRKKLGLKAWETARQLSWESVVSRLDQTIVTILANSERKHETPASA